MSEALPPGDHGDSSNAAGRKPDAGAEPTPSIARPQRPKGRPRRADAPIVPWDVVDKLLIFGEVVKDPINGLEAVKFPSISDLARRYGISRTRVWQFTSKYKCFQRREEARLKTQVRYEHKVIERTAGARALATQDVVEVVDDYIRRFRDELGEGKVRTDSPSDLDRLVRLKELLVGNADSRSDLQGELSLTAIQERHRRVRAQADGLSPELTGAGGGGGGVETRPETAAPELAGAVPDAELGGEALGQ